MAVKAFLDTSVLLAGLIDFGPPSRDAQGVMDLVAERAIPKAATAWHCCLEFYSVATRMAPGFRLTPADALRLVDEEILGRLTIHDLPAANHRDFFVSAAGDRTIGGRIYDAHIAGVARAVRADVVVTDNRRHFIAALRHGIRVETPGEFLAGMRKR